MKVSQTLIIDPENGAVTALYNESVGLDVRKLGRISRAEKISDVAFNTKTQLWEAVDRKSGKVIAADASRKKCVRMEHVYYEAEIKKGRMPWSSTAKK